MSKKIDDRKYICLSATLRAKEAKFLTREQLERMLAEPGFSEACRLAAEAGYADMSGMDVAGINAALENRRAEEFAELGQMLPDQELLRLLSLQYDCHNAKVLVKSGGDLAAHAGMLSRAGCYAPEALKAVYDAEDGSGELPEALAEAIREARQALARTGNPQRADFLLDQAYFKILLDEAEATGRPFVVQYVRNRIDKVNLRSLLRTMGLGNREALLDNALIDGGSVSLDQLRDPGLGREDILRLYAVTIFDSAAEAPDMTAFEKAADNAELNFAGDARMISFGPEVVIEYAAALENEIMALRIILTGKRMGVGGEILRERLRESYV